MTESINVFHLNAKITETRVNGNDNLERINMENLTTNASG